MAIGRTFKEAFQKAMRSRELDAVADLPGTPQELRKALAIPTAERYELVLQAFRQKLERGRGARAHRHLAVLPQRARRHRRARAARSREAQRLTPELLRRMKRYGFSDKRLGELTGRGEREIRALRIEHGVLPVYKAVDTCAAEFQAETPYFYSTYEEENEAEPGDRERVVILGSGPNRIGQGIEFDYCCVHAALTAREQGYEAVMVNCNPETVSTDYDISDRLYFEPLTFEDVANIVANERPKGVIVQFGGQTPLKIAGALAEAGIPILGTPQESIDLAEDRGRFGGLLEELGIRCPEYGLATTAERGGRRRRARRLPAAGAAVVRARRPGHADRLRPAGARALHDHGRQRRAPSTPCSSTSSSRTPSRWTWTRSATARTSTSAPSCSTSRRPASTPATRPASSRPSRSARARSSRCASRPRPLALGLGVRGLINVQFAYQSYQLYVLEVNPRGSRTVPFVSKATGVPHGADRHARDPRRVARGHGPRAPRARVRERQGGRAAVQPLPGHRHAARPRDEVHRRGHGHRRGVPGGVRQGRGRRRHAAAHRGQRVPLGLRQRQVGGHHPRAAAPHARLHHLRHAGHGHGAHQPGHPGQRGEQGVPGRAQRRQPHRERRDRPRRSTRRSAAAPAPTATRSAPRRCARASRPSPRWPAPRRRYRRSRRPSGRACRYTVCRTCTRRWTEHERR